MTAHYTNWLRIAVLYSASALRLGKENPTHGLIPTYLLQWGALYVYRGQTTTGFGISPKRKRVWESSQGQLLKYRSKMVNFEATTTISELFFWASSVSKYFIIKINAFLWPLIKISFFDFLVWGGEGFIPTSPFWIRHWCIIEIGEPIPSITVHTLSRWGSLGS